MKSILASLTEVTSTTSPGAIKFDKPDDNKYARDMNRPDKLSDFGVIPVSHSKKDEPEKSITKALEDKRAADNQDAIDNKPQFSYTPKKVKLNYKLVPKHKTTSDSTPQTTSPPADHTDTSWSTGKKVGAAGLAAAAGGLGYLAYKKLKAKSAAKK